MNNLLNAFDSYGDFAPEQYFTKRFEIFPSRLSLEIPMEDEKENIDKVLEVLDFETYSIEILSKQWTTDSTRNAAEEEDYPYQYYFESTTNALFYKLLLSGEELDIIFYYDQKDKALEAWVLAEYRKIRDTFGKQESPVFEVLTKNRDEFYTEDVNVKSFNIDIKKYYNDDFVKVDQVIDKAMNVDSSGLILLHGQPGTGKTSYIKSLLTRHQDRSFIFVPNDFVSELLQPNFISFLISNKNAVLVIEDAEKVIMSREHHNNSVVSTILQLTDGLFSDYLNIKIICTFNTSIDKVDKALLRKGRMVAFYEFKALTVEKTNALLATIKKKSQNKAMTLAEIFNMHQEDFDGRDTSKKIGFK